MPRRRRAPNQTMTDSSDDDLFCSPRTTKKPCPPPEKKAKTTSILDARDGRRARSKANQLKEMNAARAPRRGSRHHRSGVAIDWDYMKRSNAARAEAGREAVDERPRAALWRWALAWRVGVASVCLMLILLKRALAHRAPA